MAADADDLLAVIAEQVEKERREKIAENNGRKPEDERQDKNLSDRQEPQTKSHETATATKAAEMFNTNRTIF